MIYRWSSSEKSVDYIGINEEEDAKLDWHDPIMGVPLVKLSVWNPPKVYQSKLGRKKRIDPGDAPMSRVVNLISKRAADELKDIWEEHATLYPLEITDNEDEELFMVVVKTAIDGLDRDKSTGPLHKYGPTPDLFAVVETWVFKEDIIGDADLFVLPDSPYTIYASEEFKQRVSDAELKGFCLKTQFWEENPWIS